MMTDHSTKEVTVAIALVQVAHCWGSHGVLGYRTWLYNVYYVIKATGFVFVVHLEQFKWLVHTRM